MSEKREAPQGFTVGTVNEPGYCESCHSRLRVGSRAAMWNPTAELFCIRCANDVGKDRDDDWVFMVLIPAMVLLALFVVLVLGLAK